MFVVTTRREPVNSISWLFQWSSSCKKAIIIKRQIELSHTNVEVRVQPHQKFV